ncbi:hypothetical protein A3Q56_02092 [Intoshia linei]|uniref:Uncharacterized protein n=1 Tax=Intoshia linei TaxID=1819745 RepID=A0A177B9P3_9BILA|nr:hypothetical protein A3Q56_02092 [Intoshia linei]
MYQVKRRRGKNDKQERRIPRSKSIITQRQVLIKKMQEINKSNFSKQSNTLPTVTNYGTNSGKDFEIDLNQIPIPSDTNNMTDNIVPNYVFDKIISSESEYDPLNPTSDGESDTKSTKLEYT